MPSNPLYVFDFTLSADDFAMTDCKGFCQQLFKKWTFQLERGETGYLHFQGRGSLWKPKRLGECINLVNAICKEMHISHTTTEVATSGDMFYVTKADTRVDGPWTDKDVELYIPRQYRDILPYPWQQKVLDSVHNFNSRIVNLIYDPAGCQGKSTIAAICCLKNNGIIIPPVNDHEKLMASVCDILSAKEERRPGPIFIDLPRYMDKSRLYGIISSIEQIKNGYSYDMRYKYKEWWFDSPPVWVFSNMELPVSSLTNDRWKIWEILEGELVPYAYVSDVSGV